MTVTYDQQTIDRIASAIYAALYRTGVELLIDDAEDPFQVALSALESDRHDSGLYRMKIETARVAAQAALEALPQPIGYAVAVRDSDDVDGEWWLSETPTSREKAIETSIDILSPWGDEVSIVVALDPIISTAKENEEEDERTRLALLDLSQTSSKESGTN